MIYRIAIVDDDINDLDKTYHLINTLLVQKNIQVDIQKYHSIQSFPIDINFDALFLDIDMPEKSGLELAREYKANHKESLIIFVTSHNELVYQACNIHPFDFIRKENLQQEITMVIEELLYKLNDMFPTVTFYMNGNAYIIQIDSIIFCESFNHHTEIHFDNHTIKINQQLSDVTTTINTDYFMRVGRSYLVNMKKVLKFENNTLYLPCDYQVPISRRNKTKVMDCLKEVVSHDYGN